ncbi:MAG: hypothetical protein OER95_20080 [Acidimicrobiia bacterium]|nr:hypothetical protein [Acidimicrobiia bacterium]
MIVFVDSEHADGYRTENGERILAADDRRLVGTQFHPEYWTDDHPDGRTVIANFLDWIA